MTTPIIPKADEVQRYELVSHGQYSMRYESLDKDPDGDWVKHDDHLRVVGELRASLSVTRAPSPAVGGEKVSEEEVTTALRLWYTPEVYDTEAKAGMIGEKDRRDMRAALEAFVRGRGKS